MNFRLSITILFFAVLFSKNGAFSQKISKAEQIDQYLQTMLAKSNVPGFAAAVVNKDTTIFSKGYGSNSNGKSISSHSPFAIASLSKAFTAMAIMQLVSEEKINLDHPVTQYISSFSLNDPRGKDLTVRQVLNQTSGLSDIGFPELAFNEQPENLDHAIARLNEAKLDDKPGEKFHYHNPNYQILAKIVEAVSHEKFAIYLDKNILRPLKMNSTTDASLTKSFNKTSENFSNGHIFFLGKALPIQEPDWFVEGAAGLVSNVNDLSHWLRLQLNNGQFENKILLDSASLKMMQTAPANFPYGMGWFDGKDGSISHSGILWTYSAEELITKNGYGIVILFNGGLNPFVDYHAFIQGVADILEDKEPEIPVLPSWVFGVCVGVILAIAVGFAFRRLFRNKQWWDKYHSRPVWRSWINLVIRLLPLIFVICIPAMVTLLSHRVLNWKRIFLMLPDVIIGLWIIALLNLLIVATRIFYMQKFKKS